MAFEIKRAEATDALLMGELQARTWRESYRGIVDDGFLDRIDPIAGSRSFLEHLLKPEFEFYLARLEGEAVGRLALAQNGPKGEIEAIYLLREAQGKGYGRRLMDFTLARLAARGCTEAGLWVLGRNTGAVAFYEKMGFASAGESETELDGKSYPTLRYVYNI